ncbi:MAG: FKBP-type peptidyl-prolyl cis-trans isomerase [Solirubrobacteraceae bacterium]
MRVKTGTTALVAAAIALGLAGCGSSRAPGVQLAPQEGATTPPITTATSASVTTPKTGPLSKEPSFKVPSGPPPAELKVINLITGTGTAAQDGDELWVNYVGKLYKGGKTFDASWKDTPGTAYGPLKLGAGAVIAGWDQGLLGMKVGGRRELIIPPGLAYKAKGSPPSIPGNATLVFVVDLLKLSK